MMGKKGLALGLLALMIAIFITVLFSLLSMTMWNVYESALDDLPNGTIQEESIAKAKEYRSKMLWADKLFVIFFIILLSGYLISSVTLPADSPVFLLIFFGILIVFTAIAMIFTNAWEFLLEYGIFFTAAQDLTFMDFFMTNFPVINFFTGIIGAVIFYGRKKFSGGGGGNIDGIE